MYIYIVLNLLVFSLGQKFGGKPQLFLLKQARVSEGKLESAPVLPLKLENPEVRRKVKVHSFFRSSWLGF